MNNQINKGTYALKNPQHSYHTLTIDKEKQQTIT